jgi:predicted nucleotidyltransferase/uncharacterized protein with HEPN domain
VFGSFARGEARSDSDVDIVFETNEPNLFRTARMRAELESLLARPVEVVRLRERMNRRLRQRILQEARLSDTGPQIERLEDVLTALERIPRRFAGIDSAAAFEQSEEGRDRLDAICMILVAVGEALKQVDKTEGRLLARYPEVEWQGVIGVRNVSPL